MLRTSDFRHTSSAPNYVRIVFALAAFVAQVFAMDLTFNRAVCDSGWSSLMCTAVSGSSAVLLSIIGIACGLALLRPGPIAELLTDAGTRPGPAAINLLGACLAILPAVVLRNNLVAEQVPYLFFLWLPGIILLCVGAALFVAPSERWLSYFRSERYALPCLLGGAFAPLVAASLRTLWDLDVLAEGTFRLVTFILRFLGYDVQALPADRIIGSDGFYVSVARACSGVEGMALVTVFITIYLLLFRKDLRFPGALVLYPIGIVTSAVLNVVRIAVLLIIGLEGNPSLAVGAFHSNAGWLMFTVIALGVILVAQRMPRLKKAQVQGAGSADLRSISFREDKVAAFILPFAAFMLTAVPLSAFSDVPSLFYPIRVLIVGAVLLFFLPAYKKLEWRFSAHAIAIGSLVGAFWVLLPAPASNTASNTLEITGGLLLVWLVLRGVGTIVLVPLLEEVFFRGYLTSRLVGSGGIKSEIFAAVVTSALFAALHARWFEAFVAGLLFAWCARRPKGCLSDAIIAHLVSNAIVFAFAALKNDLTII